MKMKTSLQDRRLITSIALRAMLFEPQNTILGPIPTYDEIVADLSACHLNGTPLNLAGLLKATTFDFVHDVVKIHQHLNRDTGKLEHCFEPRFARKEEHV